MPMYEFSRESDGKVVEFHFRMADAPSIGSVIERDGVKYTRLVSDSQLSSEIDIVTHKYPYVSRSLPKNLPGCDSNNKGQPIITSRRHEREIMGRYGLERE